MKKLFIIIFSGEQSVQEPKPKKVKFAIPTPTNNPPKKPSQPEEDKNKVVKCKKNLNEIHGWDKK